MNSVKAQQSYGFLVTGHLCSKLVDQVEYIGHLAKKKEKDFTMVDHRLIFRDFTDKKQ